VTVMACRCVTSSAPAGTPSPSPSSVPRLRPHPTVIRVVMGGDVLLREGLWAVAAEDARDAGRPADALDFSQILRPIRPWFLAPTSPSATWRPRWRRPPVHSAATRCSRSRHTSPTRSGGRGSMRVRRRPTTVWTGGSTVFGGPSPRWTARVCGTRALRGHLVSAARRPFWSHAASTWRS
jgi:hypothetical protein